MRKFRYVGKNKCIICGRYVPKGYSICRSCLWKKKYLWKTRKVK